MHGAFTWMCEDTFAPTEAPARLAMAASPQQSARNLAGSDRRTASCDWNGRSSQRRRPGSLGRRTRSHRRVPLRERSPGKISDRHHVWVKRGPSRRAETDAVLTRQIHAAHASSRGTYGAPRVHAELAAKGLRVGRKRVARLMQVAGLAGVSRRKFVTTTVRGDGRQAPDLVERNFVSEAPDRLWVADITYVPTWAGFLYLSVVLDAFSRRIVGWSMATTLVTQLVLDALNMALLRRRPRGVIHHSDQGSQPGLKWSSQRL